MDSEITALDLFSGIGGFSLGLERAGPFRTVAFCEQDKFCQAVLRKHWPEVPIYDDVRTIPTDELGRIDLVCGGVPCQPWSVAGQQRGAEDDRDLWPAMASLIEKLRPKFVIGENVRGFVNEPLGLQRSLSDLESLGYQAVPFIVPACAVDAPHRRDRVWIVAHRTGLGRQEGAAQAGWQKGDGAIGPGCATDVADAACELSHGRGEPRRRRRQHSDGGADVVDADSQRLQGIGADSNSERRQEPAKRSAGLCNGTASAERWATEPDVGRVAHGVPNRVDRLKALGNAVVPQVAEQIGRAIIQSHYSID